MQKRMVLLILLVGLVMVSVTQLTQVMAHVPLNPMEGETLADAPEIRNPTKSWVFYGDLHEGGEAHYYRFNATAGMRIRFTVTIPVDEVDHGFRPGMVLIGPGLNTTGMVPAYVEIPNGSNGSVYPGVVAETPVYEPFSPSLYYLVVDVNVNAPEAGTYYLAVYADNHGGRYGIALGYIESYTPLEWISVPLNVLQIYMWEGQLLSLIFLPLFLIVFVGLAYDRGRYQYYTETMGLLVSGRFAGWLYLGSAAVYLNQTISKILFAPLDPLGGVSLVFGVIPALLGFRILQLLEQPQMDKLRSLRGQLALLGLLGLFGWSGFYIGPAYITIIAVISPLTLSSAKTEHEG